jgi:hypothetical protein
MYLFADYTEYELLTALQAVHAVKRDSHFSGFAPRANLSHVTFLSDGTLEVVRRLKNQEGCTTAKEL